MAPPRHGGVAAVLHLLLGVAGAGAGASPARCTRQEATDFQAPGSKCPGKPCADLGGEGGAAHAFGAADAEACCQLCADYEGSAVCKYAVFQPGADKSRNCFLKAAPADPIVGGTGNLGMELLPPSSGWGSTLLVMLVLCGAAYVGGGVAFGTRTSGKQGLAAHPHYQKWIDLQGLVVDGGSAVRSSGSGAAARRRSGDKEGGGGGYHSTAETEPLQGKHRDRRRSPSKEKHKTATNGGGGNKRKKEKQPSSSVAIAQPAAPPAQATGGGPAGGTALQSAAGDGGRWVHVPN